MNYFCICWSQNVRYGYYASRFLRNIRLRIRISIFLMMDMALACLDDLIVKHAYKYQVKIVFEIQST